MAAEETLPATPRTTPDLLGHAAAERTLLEAVAGGRLPHAWLLHGPRGVGKATLAYRLARFVLAGAADGPSEEGAGGLFGTAAPPAPPVSLATPVESPVFRRTASGTHGDLLVLERAVDDKGRLRNEITVDDVRRLIPFFGKTAAEGGWRIAVIDAADELNRNAANAVLKVLEEPPARSLILLVCHAPGRLLPTLRSRCARLALTPLENDDVRAVLQRHVPTLEADEIDTVIALSGGRPGRAVRLARDGGAALYRDMSGLLAQLPDVDATAVHGLADRVRRRTGGDSFAILAELLEHWFMGLLRSGAGAGSADPLFARLLAARGLEDWLVVWDKIARVISRTDAANLDRKQVVLTVFATLSEAARG